MTQGILYDVPDWFYDNEPGDEEITNVEPEFDKDSIIEMVEQRKNLEAEEEALAKRIKELSARKATRGKQIDWINNGIIARMQTLNLNKLKTPEHTVSICQRGDALEVVDQDLLPKEFLKTTVTVAKADLNKFAKAHGNPPGTKWVSGGVSLMVR